MEKATIKLKAIEDFNLMAWLLIRGAALVEYSSWDYPDIKVTIKETEELKDWLAGYDKSFSDVVEVQKE